MERVFPPRSADTTPEAELVQIELIRAASPARRAHQALSLSADVISAARRAFARARPLASAIDLDLQFVEVHHGRELAEGLRAEFIRRSRGRPSEA
jgi:broad specificity phosphatase PhoE